MKKRFFPAMMVLVMTAPLSRATDPAGDTLNIGPDNTVLAGSYSGAIGEGNTVSGDSLTVGVGNVIFGVHNFALFGSGNSVNAVFGSGDPYGSGGAEDSTLISGSDNWIYHPSAHSGLSNALIGYGNSICTEPSGSDSYVEGSVLVGKENSTNRTESWVIGTGNTGQYRTVTLAAYAAPVSDASLIVGTGTSDTDRSNGLVVLKDGTVIVPSGVLLLGSEDALTPTSAQTVISSHLTTNGYLKDKMGVGADSFAGLAAWGDGAYANMGSVAMGVSANASGWESVAMGESTTSSGDYSVCIGLASSSGGLNSVALGLGATANGDFSVAFTGGVSSGLECFSGSSGVASGDLSIALGYSNASGASSVTIGGHDWDYPVSGVHGNQATGPNSLAFGGAYNQAIGFASVATGNWSIASSAYSTALGSLNKGAGTSATTWVETDPLLEVGNGATPRGTDAPSPTLRSNAITVRKNGQTTLTNKFWDSGAPTDIPTDATNSSNGEALVVEGHTRLKGKVIMEQAQGDISMGIYGD